MCNISLCQVLLLAECSVDNEVHVLFNILSHSNKSAIFISINCIIHIGHVINVSDNPLLLFKCRKPDYSVLLFITLSFYASSVSHPSTGKNLFSFFKQAIIMNHITFERRGGGCQRSRAFKPVYVNGQGIYGSDRIGMGGD